MADAIPIRRPFAAVRLRAAAAAPSPAENYAIATIACLLVATGFLAFCPGARHWFVLPSTIAGVIAAADVVAWVRRQVDAFDPKGLIGCVLVHTTFTAPLLHMGLEAHDPQFTAIIDDWGNWFGVLGLFYVVSLVMYKAAQRYTFGATKPTRVVWQVNNARFASLLAWGVAVSGITAGVVLFRFGGLAKEGEGVGVTTAMNLSWVLMLSDPLPLLAMMGVIYLMSRRGRQQPLVVVLTMLAVFLVAQFLLLGLRGSRSAMIFALFLVTCMVHYRLRRFPITVILLGALVLFIGGYFYKFYKLAGSRGAAAALAGDEQLASVQARTGINPVGVLLGDLARADVQAVALFRYARYGDRYNLRWGETYVVSAAVVIPRALWPNKPLSRSRALTNLFYGEGTYEGGSIRSSRILGLLGEALLNFGMVGIPIMYLIFGIVVGWYRKKLLTMDPGDGRLFIVPLFTLAFMLAPFGDSDNIAFGFLKNGALPIAVILLSTNAIRPALNAVLRRPIAATSPGGAR